MTKIKLFSKLNLNKQTIVKLNNDQMNAIVGGTDTITAIDTLRSSDTLKSSDTVKATADSIAAIR